METFKGQLLLILTKSTSRHALTTQAFSRRKMEYLLTYTMLLTDSDKISLSKPDK
jgi:hypothetical protein